MIIKQIYTGCLNEAAYFVESEGQAAIIDPIRETDDYLALAKKHKATIKYIFETHFHADFVSGHLDLSQKTGADIVFGPSAEARFKFHAARDGEIFTIGNITIEAIHTPGHTLESTSYLLRDESGKPYCIFTGDTLRIGKKGNTGSNNSQVSVEELAGILYQTLQEKILPLPDDLIIYPAHGAAEEDFETPPRKESTIGHEKRDNPALQPQSVEEFTEARSKEQQEEPPYFRVNAKINREGYSPLSTVILNSLVPIALKDFVAEIQGDSIVLDTRNVTEFTQGFVPGSLSIGLEGKFAEWAGRLLPFDRPIILITEAGQETESIVRLARVGFENVKGYLEGGFHSWIQHGHPADLIIDIEADELAMDLPFDENLLVLDVRHANEFIEGHIKDALNLPLHEMADVAQIASIEEEQNLYIQSANGYRSVTAASLLKKQGYHNLRNVRGGYTAVKDQEGIITEKSGEVLN